MSFTHVQELATGRPVPTSEHSPNGPRQPDTNEEKTPQAKKKTISDSEHRERETETRQEKEIRLTREYLFRMASSSSNVVGVHYRVGKKIGEGSFGVIFEGTNLLNNQQVAIKFVGVEDTISPREMLSDTGTTEERCTTTTRRVSDIQDTRRLPWVPINAPGSITC